MSLNSVNTNIGAMIALQSLNRTNADPGSHAKADFHRLARGGCHR